MACAASQARPPPSSDAAAICSEPLAPAQCGQAESLLFGRILNRLLGFRLRLGRRFDGRFGRTRSTTVQMAPGRSVLRRRVRWRVCQAANNAFDSVAPGTSREQRCKNENCSDAHHDTALRTGCAANADKLGQPGTFLTSSGPYRLLRNYARCALCWFRRRYILVFHTGEMLSCGACSVHRAVCELAAG